MSLKQELEGSPSSLRQHLKRSASRATDAFAAP